jgi:hypothetical protein
MGATYDTGISKRLGIMVAVLVALLVAFHLAGFSIVGTVSGSVKL